LRSVAREPLDRQLAVRDGREHGAAGLALVRAVAKLALLRKRGDVGEARLDSTSVVEQAEFAHSGRVDQYAAFGQDDELARARRVPAALVVA
jgi:hypothetical protein